MPETLETLAEKIVALTASMEAGFTGVGKRFEQIDQRFEQVNQRFETVADRFGELKAELRTQIEAVDAKVGLVLEKVDDLIERDIRHAVTHARFEQRFDNLELRVSALEAKEREDGE